MLDMAKKAISKTQSLSRGAYDADENLRLALTHLIQIIGEAERQVSREFSEQHPEIPWADIVGMRHKVVHDDLERRVKLRHEDEALDVCKGIVLGLYRAEHRSFELLEYAEDSPSELAGRAVEICRRRRREWTFPHTFVEKYTPNWAWLVR
jgi:ribonuclease HepT-like protein